jgi:cytochrome P450 family 110
MNPLPPGPTKLSLPMFVRAGFFDPAPVMDQFTVEFGDTIRFPSPNGMITITSNPDAIRAIYTADPDTFDAWGGPITEPVFGTTGLVVASGARHKRDRKLLTPPFNASTMRAYGRAMVEATRSEAARLVPGRRFSALQVTQDIALEVIIRVVFGVEGADRVAATRAAVLELIESLSPALFLFPKLRRPLANVGPWARNRRAGKALDALLLEEIRARRAGKGASDRQDILGLMLRARYDDGTAMEDQALLDQLRTLLFAGHETTAVSLAWTLYWLHREPQTLARVLAEIDAIGPDPDPNELAALPYLDAACCEGLRLAPPVADTGRLTRAPFDMVGFTVPAGEGVGPSPMMLHRRKDIYPEPQRFRPERFLERKFSPFEFIPFGGGSRRCLGAAFAMYEMKIVLGTFLREGRVKIAPGTRAPVHVRRGLTFGPRGGIPMILEQRRGAPIRVRAAREPAEATAKQATGATHARG